MAATTTFLDVTNRTIFESGTDLDQFATDGSDFNAIGLDPLMYQFKRWVARAWQTVQQDAYDWEFLEEQAVVTLNPGIMFYSDYPITTLDVIYNATIYDQDGTAVTTPVPVYHIEKLTGIFTDTLNYGYVSITSDNTNPVTFELKSGGEYFFAPCNVFINLTSRTHDIIYSGNIANGDQLASISYSTFDAFGNQLAGQTQVVGEVTLVASDASEFGATITGGIGEWWSEVLGPILANTAYNFTRVSVETVNGGAASLLVYTPSYNTQSSVALTQHPLPVIDQTAEAKECGVWGANVVISGMTAGDLITSVVISNSGSVDGTYTNNGVVTFVDGFVGVGRRFFFEVTDPGLLNAIQYANGESTGNVTMVFKNNSTTLATATKTQVNSTNNYFFVFFPTKTGDPGKMHVHSWQSYDWDEETETEDFVENVAELDQQSFRIVYREDPTPSTELKLSYVPWEQFLYQMDNANQPPGQPRLVTEDNTGRWKFYPALDRPYTFLFDYSRNPQKVVDFDDIFKKIPDDLTDIIMWQALVYYGEYQEQPSIIQRATKNYKNLMFRMQLRFRDKFHFKSAFSFGGWS